MCSFCGKEISSGLQPLQISKSQAVSESCLCTGMSVLCWIPSICCLGVCVVSCITISYTDEFLLQAKFRENPGWGSTRSHQSPVISSRFSREVHRYSILHYMMILARLYDVIRKYICLYTHINEIVYMLSKAWKKVDKIAINSCVGLYLVTRYVKFLYFVVCSRGPRAHHVLHHATRVHFRSQENVKRVAGGIWKCKSKTCNRTRCFFCWFFRGETSCIALNL